MKYLGKEILKRTETRLFHRHDNCGEVPPIYFEKTYYRFKGSTKEFTELSALKFYIRKLKKSKNK